MDVSNSTPPRAPVAFERPDWRARYYLFEKYGLNDQRSYYNRTREKYQAAAMQVNRIRAILALLTGFCAALAGLLVQIYFSNETGCNGIDAAGACGGVSALVLVLTVLSVVLPAFAALFNTLADLYQWDRQIEVYEAASRTLEVADAQSPLEEETDAEYRAALIAYAEGTLSVMRDETAQWGQSIRTPQQLEEFIENQRKIARQVNGDADAGRDEPATPR